MAKTIEKCLKRSLVQEKCVLKLQVNGEPVINAGPNLNHVGKVDYDDVVDLEGTELIESLGLLAASTCEKNGPFVEEETTVSVDVVSVQKYSQRRRIEQGDREDTDLSAGATGTVVLRVHGKKERLKHLNKAPLFESFGRIMGLSDGSQKARIIKALSGAIRFKRDGISSRKVVHEKEATKLLAEVEVMQRLCNDSGKVLLPGMVEEVHKDVMRYWLRRYSLFSRFDHGIKLDEEGLFSVTPEEIAKHQAAHCAGSGSVIDAFTGAGGNAIQFALMNLHVIAIDIDPKKIEYARHNASVYGVADKIDFIVGDFFQLAPTLKAEVVFLSPPWGGPEYIRAEKYNIETMLRPKDGFFLFRLALSVAPSVAFFLPRTVDTEQLAQLSWLSSPPLPYEVERNYVNNELKAVTAYYGKIAS